MWKIDVGVATVYSLICGIFVITSLSWTFLPFVVNTPFSPYSTLFVHRLSVVIGKVIIPIVDAIVHTCFIAYRYVAGVILWPVAQTSFGEGNFYTKALKILPGEYEHLRVWWENGVPGDSLDKIDTSQRIQEEAIIWLSQMPLDLNESKDVVSSLALITTTRPCRFPKSVVVFLNQNLERSFRGIPNKAQIHLAIDCILVLGQIKYQSVVDRNLDYDHEVGEIPVTPLVACAAQQLTIKAFDENINTPHSKGIRARLLTAAAWLSPMDAFETTLEGEELKIRDRWEFVDKLRTTLEQQVRSENPLVDVKVLVNLIRGMHACIPRGDYGSPSLIVPFLPLICEDFDSPWSEDESVLGALITYALDLLLPPTRRRPLVERWIEFDSLASELIDALTVDTALVDVVAFVFWLIYRVPYAFRSRKSITADIVSIWASTNGTISQDLRQRINFLAVDALVAVTQHRAFTDRTPPKLDTHNAPNLLNAALECSYTRPMAIYAVAMIFDLGASTQATHFTRGIDAKSFTETLHTVRSDLEKNAVEEDVVDLHIYSTLVLLKLPEPRVGVGSAKALIEELEKTIGNSITSGPKLARNPEAEICVDLSGRNGRRSISVDYSSSFYLRTRGKDS